MYKNFSTVQFIGIFVILISILFLPHAAPPPPPRPTCSCHTMMAIQSMGTDTSVPAGWKVAQIRLEPRGGLHNLLGSLTELGFSSARVDPRVDPRVYTGHFWLGSAFLRAKLGPTCIIYFLTI